MLRVSFANAGTGLPRIPRQLHKNIVYLKRVYPESSPCSALVFPDRHQEDRYKTPQDTHL